MRKIAKLLCTFMLLLVAFYFVSLISDKKVLSEELIRLHVVADSDSAEDQAIKLFVRDAITEKLETAMVDLSDVNAAKTYLQDHLSELEHVANDALKTAGSSLQAAVTMEKEAFPTREYDTFALPAGVYESLRITIGSGAGKNWWCVIFPSLCVGATTSGVEDTAAGSGFSDSLAGSITGKQEYRVRFFLLDCLGWVENWIFQRDF